MSVRVQQEDFDIGRELQGFGRNAGAIVTFTGIVRDNENADLSAMEIEHYPDMSLRALEDIKSKAMQRWQLSDALIIHRFGRLAPQENIMMVATAATHRADAFAAAEFLMDYLKSRAPFWKKEIAGNRGDWVDGKKADEDALKRW